MACVITQMTRTFSAPINADTLLVLVVYIIQHALQCSYAAGADDVKEHLGDVFTIRAPRGSISTVYALFVGWVTKGEYAQIYAEIVWHVCVTYNK